MPIIVLGIIVLVITCAMLLGECAALQRKLDDLQCLYNEHMKLMNDRETQNREAYRWASARDVQENQRLRVELDALKRQLQTTAH